MRCLVKRHPPPIARLTTSAVVLNDTSPQPSRSHGRRQFRIMPLQNGNRSTHLTAQGVDVYVT